MAPNTGKRVKGMAIARPILYGNVATPLEEHEKTAETPVDHTHKWTVFVRDPNFPSGGTNSKADLSYFIKKVVFKLHDTYPQPSRSIESPPFEVTETGWGEFEISIRIFFVSEANEKNVLLYHHLKLHPYGQGVEAQAPALAANGQHSIPPAITNGAAQSAASNTNGNGQSDATGNGEEPPSTPTKPNPGPVESYQYEELVFNEPTEAMVGVLTSRAGALVPSRRSDRIKYSTQAETEELDRLSSALDSVYQQVQKTKERIVKLEKEQESRSKPPIKKNDDSDNDLSAADSSSAED